LIISQACIAVILPVSIVAIFYLTSKKTIMKGETNSWIDVVILCLIMVFSLYVSALGIKGLIADLSGLFM